MSNLLDSLKSLKNKINEIEESTKLPITSDEKPVFVDNSAIIKETLLKLKELQSQKVVINVGGKLYSFSQSTLSNTITENIFSNGEKSIFYDGSPDLFNYVSEIIRGLNKQRTETEEKFKIVVKQSDDDVIVKEMLKQIFPKADEELFPKLSLEKEVIVQRNTNLEVNQQPVQNNANYDNYGGGNAAYQNYNY
jgi:hypothetical protein